MADTRTCIGSAKFGIERHEAPIVEFPVQPSQRDGLGRMCRPHWQAYTQALRRGSAAPVAAPAVAAVDRAKADRTTGRAAQQALRAKSSAKTAKPEPIRTKPARRPNLSLISVTRGAADLD